jgi:hypothetical protein
MSRHLTAFDARILPGERREPAFGITIYRDEPGEANIEARFVGTEPAAVEAIAEARKCGPLQGWPLWSASVDEGESVTQRTGDGINLTHFEDSPNGRHWYLGPTWIDGPHA